MGGEITRNDIGHAAMNPRSNGRAWDVQLREELTVSRFADCFLDSVVVGPPRVESFHTWNVSAEPCGRVGRLRNVLCFRGVAVVTHRVQNVMRRSSATHREGARSNMRPTYSWQKVRVEIAETPVVRHVTRTLVAPDGTRHRIRVPVYGRPVLASRDDPVEIVASIRRAPSAG